MARRRTDELAHRPVLFYVDKSRDELIEAEPARCAAIVFPESELTTIGIP